MIEKLEIVDDIRADHAKINELVDEMNKTQELGNLTDKLTRKTIDSIFNENLNQEPPSNPPE
jgi:hypothetical protein